jgi:hypothetical protein
MAFDNRLHCIDENLRDPEMTRMVNAIEKYFILVGKLTLSMPVWKIHSTRDWKDFLEAGTFIYR